MHHTHRPYINSIIHASHTGAGLQIPVSTHAGAAPPRWSIVSSHQLEQLDLAGQLRMSLSVQRAADALVTQQILDGFLTLGNTSVKEKSWLESCQMRLRQREKKRLIANLSAAQPPAAGCLWALLCWSSIPGRSAGRRLDLSPKLQRCVNTRRSRGTGRFSGRLQTGNKSQPAC